jgi:DNA integrity scanning protein DisA with diadenylate cyclase activity
VGGTVKQLVVGQSWAGHIPSRTHKEKPMLKKFGCAIAVLMVGSIALAETVRGVITEVKDDEITVTVRVKGERKGEKKTFKLAKKVKVLKMKGKDDSEDSTLSALKEAIEKSKGRRKGAAAVIEVKDGTATEIKFGGERRGKRKKKDI